MLDVIFPPVERYERDHQEEKRSLKHAQDLAPFFDTEK